MKKLTKYNHVAKDFWQACGFNKDEIDEKIKVLVPTFQKLELPSRVIEFLEKTVGMGEREKMCMAFHVSGLILGNKFSKAMDMVVAASNKERKEYEAEIARLGGSILPQDFGKVKTVAKKTARKAR